MLHRVRGCSVTQKAKAAQKTSFQKQKPPAFCGAFEGVDLLTIMADLPVGVFLLDTSIDGSLRCLMTNRFFENIIGLTVNPRRYFALDELVNIWEARSLISGVLDCLESGAPQVGKWTYKTGAEARHLEFNLSPMSRENGMVTRVLGTVADRTRQRRAEQQILYDARHDNLTGLANRVLFGDLLERAGKEAAQAPGKRYAVLTLNIDRFQGINESLGHIAGDEMLVAVARRLQKCLSPGNTLARLGGDEFAILIPDAKDENDAVKVAERIHTLMQLPLNLGGTEAFSSVSAGVAISAERDNYAEDLLRDADLALHRAKARGGACTEVFRQELHTRARSLLALETDLRHAIKRSEFHLDYQPIVTLKNGALASFEALLRWHHPQRGIVAPADFIPLAETTGLIVPIGRWVLYEACRQLAQWRKQFAACSHLIMSVNVSGVQFSRQDLVGDLRDALEKSGLDGTALKLEITESAIMESPEIAAEVLHALKKLGVTLAVDDFGTGYSSLGYLNRFPIDTLKIDRSFIASMDENAESYKIVKIITMLADTLNLSVIAEGIERPDQKARLGALGCPYGQGYYFSRPLPAGALESTLAKNLSWPLPSKTAS